MRWLRSWVALGKTGYQNLGLCVLFFLLPLGCSTGIANAEEPQGSAVEPSQLTDRNLKVPICVGYIPESRTFVCPQVHRAHFDGYAAEISVALVASTGLKSFPIEYVNFMGRTSLCEFEEPETLYETQKVLDGLPEMLAPLNSPTEVAVDTWVEGPTTFRLRAVKDDDRIVVEAQCGKDEVAVSNWPISITSQFWVQWSPEGVGILAGKSYEADEGEFEEEWSYVYLSKDLCGARD